MKYPKFLQVLTIAAVVTSAMPSAYVSVLASDTKETPKEYEIRTEYNLPDGYHYVLSEEKYVIVDEDGKVKIEKDEQKKTETVKAEPAKKEPEKKEVQKTETKKEEPEKSKAKKESSGSSEEKKQVSKEKKQTFEKELEAKEEKSEGEKPDQNKKGKVLTTQDISDPDREIITTEDGNTNGGTEGEGTPGGETGGEAGSGESSGGEISGETGSAGNEGNPGGETGSETGSEENLGGEIGGETGSGESSGGEISGEIGSEENPGGETGSEEDPGGETGSEENPGGEVGGETGSGESSGGEISGETGSEENPGGETGSEENPGGETGDVGNLDGTAGGTEEFRRPGETGMEAAEQKPEVIEKQKKKASKKVKNKDKLKPRETKTKLELDFKTSKPFYEIGERICYNEEVPIDGIPSFITQEMIVGALKAQDETGYPASVTIAQIINESGYGKYGPGGDEGQGLSYLAYQYCNLFGIKGTGTAGSALMNTKEMTPSGQTYSTQAGFRAYNTYTECIEDRSELLENVYSDLTAGAEDANTFAVRIGGRWATSINYGQGLIKTMETYDLYRLDEMTLVDFSQLMGTFANPCPGSHITSNFGYRSFDNKFHKGLDMGTGAENIPTYAAEAGTVVFAGSAGAAGNLITIDHGNGLVTKYMHHSQIYVKLGQKVEKGQQIGLSGTTGRSTGNHLHFQVEKNSIAMNPTIYLMDEIMQAKADK